MKKVVIFGAAGHTGKYITKKMKCPDYIKAADTIADSKAITN